MKRARPAHAAHDLVENEEHAIAVANGAYPREIIGHRRHGPGCRANDGFGDKGDDRVRAKLKNLVFKLLSRAGRIIGVAFAFAPVPVGVARIDMMGLGEERRELSAAPFVPPRREGAKRVAMIALAPSNDVAPLELANLNEILP